MMAHHCHGQNAEIGADANIDHPGTIKQSDAHNWSVGRVTIRDNPPALFHKVKDKKSILALVVSNSQIYAGTQGGEILVSRVTSYLLHSSVLRSAHLDLVLGHL